MKTSEELYQQIREHPHLPSPTGMALAVLRLAADENCDISDLAAVIEKDPAMAARMLRLVNSPLFGHSQSIMSLPQAIAFLGLRTVKFISLGFSLVSAKTPHRCRSFPYERFWSESLGIAVAARHISAAVSIFPPDDVLACGLLCQIGRLSLASVHPGEYADIVDAVGADATPDLLQLEREMFRMDHNELASRMMENWKLPPVFSMAVQNQDQAPWETPFAGDSPQNQLARMLHLSRGIAGVLVNETPGVNQLNAVRDEVATVGLSANQLFEYIRDEWREAGVLFEVQTRVAPPFEEILAQARQLQTRIKAELDAQEIARQIDSRNTQ